MSATVPRRGARVLLVDPDDRVLLIHERDPDGGSPWWLTPGGGIEEFENPRQAAVREVYEETGIDVRLEPDAEIVFTEQRVWHFQGTTYDQRNEFFAARVAGGLAVNPAAPTAAEVQYLLGHRWWSAAELRASTELIYPGELPDLLERVCGRLPRL